MNAAAMALASVLDHIGEERAISAVPTHQVQSVSARVHEGLNDR